jgi:transcription antitermination factor NusG
MRWYVARTKPRREQEAAHMLQDRGVDVYLPKLRHARPRPGRSATETLFPSYLFAHLQVPSDQWLAARSAPQVAYFLTQEGVPIPVPTEFVIALEERVEQVNRCGGLPRFKHGDRVVIRRAELQYLDAIFDRTVTAAGRVRVLVQFLNRQISVDVHEDWLDKAG